MNPIQDFVGAHPLAIACLLGACIALVAVVALKRAASTVRRILDDRAWSASTAFTAAEADALYTHIDLAEAIDAAISPQRIAQLRELYVLEGEQP